MTATARPSLASSRFFQKPRNFPPPSQSNLQTEVPHAHVLLPHNPHLHRPSTRIRQTAARPRMGHFHLPPGRNRPLDRIPQQQRRTPAPLRPPPPLRSDRRRSHQRLRQEHRLPRPPPHPHRPRNTRHLFQSAR